MKKDRVYLLHIQAWLASAREAGRTIPEPRYRPAPGPR
jgi:hypothetical protein